MQELVSKYEFVEPNVKIELEGELGLSLHEIAKSLQTQYYNVKKKIDRMIKDDRLKIVIPYGIPNNSNGLQTESYILPVSEAKFFVAKYDNEIGDAYTRFLIKCEETLLKKMREELSKPKIIQQPLITVPRFKNDSISRAHREFN